MRLAPVMMAGLLVGAAALSAADALAAWNAAGRAVLPVQAARIPPGHRPTVGDADEGGGRTVTWQGTYFSSGDEVGGYRLNQQSGSGAPVQVCEVIAPVHSCAVSRADGDRDGAVSYTVVPVQGTWTGPASPPTLAGGGGEGDSPPPSRSPTPTPTPTPRPSPSQSPTPSPNPSRSPHPTPTPEQD